MPREMAYTAEQCRNCRFFRWESRKGNRCRRYPPSIDGALPQVEETGWCGEWREQRKDQPNMWEGDVIEQHQPGALTPYRGGR
jgi:hypothetical protein